MNSQATSIAPAQVSPPAAPLVPIQVGVDAPPHRLAEANRSIEQMKSAFVGCRQRALTQASAGTADLQGSFHLVIGVGPSGEVSWTKLPSCTLSSPMFNSCVYGPNPDNAELDRIVIPCIRARAKQARFRADGQSWVFVAHVLVQ